MCIGVMNLCENSVFVRVRLSSPEVEAPDFWFTLRLEGSWRAGAFRPAPCSGGSLDPCFSLRPPYPNLLERTN